ncbi:MAG: NrsF family protein [Asticcacaulis sp.]|uniref:NrsF family protein n=1 Tax=Asticcacaulis sp. TaxID=1872648 RepID=UPI0039E2DAC1
MSDGLLDNLTQDLKPVKPLNAKPLWLGAGVAVGLAAAYVWFIFGPRPELSALTYGNWSGNNMAFGKPLMFLIIGGSALWAVSDLARPEGRFRMRTWLPMLAIFAGVIGVLMSYISQLGMEKALAPMHGPARLCYITIICGGVAGLLILWRLWLRRSATSHPALLGAMSGLAASSLMAGAYALHCNQDEPAYLLAVYGVSLIIVTAAAALAGAKLLRW